MANSEKTLVVVTGNKGKAAEIASITGWSVEAQNLDIAEIQSLDVEEVAKSKALAAYKIIQRPVVVDDTGMSIEALNGLPGALVSWFLDTLGPKGILDLLPDIVDRRASVCTCVGYADQNGARTFVGKIEGRLSSSLRGENGFGYDPIFIPEGQERTYAEMTSEEKNAISMRKMALMEFKEYLSTLE